MLNNPEICSLLDLVCPSLCMCTQSVNCKVGVYHLFAHQIHISTTFTYFTVSDDFSETQQQLCYLVQSQRVTVSVERAAADGHHIPRAALQVVAAKRQKYKTS